MLDAKVARPEDKRVNLQVADPAPLLNVVASGDHAPLARAWNLIFVAQIPREYQHFIRIILNYLFVDIATLIFQHIFQIELLANLGFPFGDSSVLDVLGTEDDRIFKLKLFFLI